ncbi:unnamed protein product, partial [Vitis vinifera]
MQPAPGVPLLPFMRRYAAMLSLFCHSGASGMVTFRANVLYGHVRGMAAAAVVMMIATSLLLIGIGSVNVGEAWEEANVIHVGGKVLCQDCTKGWNEWVNGSNPIKGSRVSVTCMDDRRRVMYYGSDETDEAGKY